ncbi:MAG TPA: hypothetical protein VIQ31_33875 [Phormidium sp.]
MPDRLFNYQNESRLANHPLGWNYYQGGMLTPFIAGQVSDFERGTTDTATCDDPLSFGLIICDANAGVGGLGVDSPGYGTAFRVELPSPANTKFTGVVRHEHIDPVFGVLRGNVARTPAVPTPLPPGAPQTANPPQAAVTPPPEWKPGAIQPPPGAGIISDPWQICFPAKYPLPILKSGRIAVQIDSDMKGVTPTCPVFVRLVDSANGIDRRGQGRIDNRDGAVQWMGARWTGRIMPGKLAELSILLP